MWTRDSSASRQVTLLFLMPVPQVTEHYRDRVSAGKSPREAIPAGQLEPYQPGLEGRWRSCAFLSLKSPERLSHCSEVTQAESIIFFIYVYIRVSVCIYTLCVCHLCGGACEAREVVGSPLELELEAVVKNLTRCWESKSGPSRREESVLSR